MVGRGKCRDKEILGEKTEMDLCGRHARHLETNRNDEKPFVNLLLTA